MQQPNFSKISGGLLLLCSYLLSGCEQQSSAPTSSSAAETASQMQSPSTDKQPDVLPIKAFPLTANDAQDIQQLEDFSLRFNAMHQDMQNELDQLQKQGSLTAEFQQNRQHDLIQSALRMLAALELKTEQGRYIQGLYAQYWENQAQITQDQDASHAAPAQAAALNEQQLAQTQLQHWKTQQPRQP